MDSRRASSGLAFLYDSHPTSNPQYPTEQQDN
jgi:hypothetical protein